MKKTKILSFVATIAMVVGLLTGPLSKPVDAATELPAAIDGKITLTEDVTVTEPLKFSSDATLDLNGFNIVSTSPTSAGEAAIYVDAGTLTIQDSVGKGSIQANYTTLSALSAGKIVINSGSIKSVANAGLEVLTGGEVTINGGSVTGQEGAAFVFGKCKLNVTGGTLTSIDNFAILGNGSTKDAGYEINVSGGIITGNIKSSGYISGGIYHPNNGTLNISGGTITANNGAGIVARAGITNITGGTIKATGTTAGWAGDKKAQIDCSALAFDAKPAIYPGYTEDACINVTGNAKLSSDSKVATVITYGDNSEGKIKLSAGTFDKDVSTYVTTGNKCVADGESYKVVSKATGINLSKTALSLEVGSSETLTATVTPEAQSIAWTSSDETVATVSNGVVKALKKGNTTITATVDDVTAKCVVYVTEVEKPVVPTVDPTKPVKDVTVGTDEKAVTTISDTVKNILAAVTDNSGTTAVDATTAAAVKAAIEAGKNIESKVETENLDPESVPTEDKGEITNLIGELTSADKDITITVAQYLDIDVALSADDEVLGNVNQLEAPITFNVALPKDIVKDGRTYYVIRVHDGVAEKLETTLNEDGTLSFATDKFSTYALVYEEETKTNEVINSTPTDKIDNHNKIETKNGSDNTVAAAVKTGDDNDSTVYMLTASASVAILAIIVLLRKKDELLNK